jgi:hypothetical protein
LLEVSPPMIIIIIVIIIICTFPAKSSGSTHFLPSSSTSSTARFIAPCYLFAVAFDRVQRLETPWNKKILLLDSHFLCWNDSTVTEFL